MSLKDIKIFILDKLHGKSAIELDFDLLVNSVQENFIDIDRETLKENVVEAFNSLIKEGKMGIDHLTGLISKKI